ncbi:MAG: GntR family transcriptional regulator [Lachnospiraceae bacterium]|nr:GntR family transcriptional regulator [Lachnospiraceae bacterium]
MGDLELNANAYLPLRDVVFNTLREAILKGELKPGERLMELQLASKLGVSRTPIREAIRMLQQEGLAVTIPRRGAEVAKMTEKNMEDVLQIREALEILAVQLACEKVTEQQIVHLGEAVEEFERAVKTGDLKQITQSDIDFHDKIYEAADNPKLVSLLNNIREQIYRYRVEYLKEEENYPNLVEEHRRIFAGLKCRDKSFVTEMTEKHLKNQANAVKAIIREQE